MATSVLSEKILKGGMSRCCARCSRGEINFAQNRGFAPGQVVGQADAPVAFGVERLTPRCRDAADIAEGFAGFFKPLEPLRVPAVK